MTGKKRALFLDRDGVINIDHGYVHRPEDFEFVEGIFRLCQTASKLGYLIIVVTNQAGIGRGYYSEQQFQTVSDWMCQQFLNHGVSIERVYHCPFHPEHGIGEYRRESFFRKPNPGMILQAAKDYGLNLASCILVGDKASDVQAGKAAGIGTNILLCDNKGQPIPQDTIVATKLKDVEKYFDV